MAGYFTKLVGNVYDGSYRASQAMPNGIFVEYSAGVISPCGAAKDTVMRVKDKTSLWGQRALVLDVVSIGNDEVYLLENEWDVNEDEIYDTSRYVCAVGQQVKIKRPLPGEQLIITVDNVLYAQLSVGDMVKVAAGGSVEQVI